MTLARDTQKIDVRALYCARGQRRGNFFPPQDDSGPGKSTAAPKKEHVPLAHGHLPPTSRTFALFDIPGNPRAAPGW